MTKLREFNQDFRDLLLAFCSEGVEFLIVGAYALALHGVPRFTGDLDVYVRPTPANAARVWRALVRFGAPIEAAGVSEKLQHSARIDILKIQRQSFALVFAIRVE